GRAIVLPQASDEVSCTRTPSASTCSMNGRRSARILLELLGGIDQEVEPGPDVVDGDEVEIPFQEWTGCVSDDDYVEVAPLISITSRGRAEHDRLLRLRQVGRQAPLQRVKIPDDGHAHERILPRGVPGAAQSRYVAARCRGSNGARGC